MTGGRAAVFLDRDGTIIEDRDFLADPAGVRLLPGAGEAIARLNRAGWPVVVVTNQSGIGRGYLTEADFLATQARLRDELHAVGARLLATYHCPHSPERVPACDCRKPAAGLFVRAAAEHALDLGRSVYIGDRSRDVEAGLDRGGLAYLIGTPGPPADRWPDGSLRFVQSLADAVEHLLMGTGGAQEG